MTTVSQAIDETLGHLTGAVGGTFNRLASGMADATTQAINLEFDNGGVVPGSVIGIGVEDIYVLEVADLSVTKCIRGYRGTTASVHNTGDVVQVDARFTRGRILTALRNEIASWGSRLYKVDGSNISLASDTRGYGLSGLGANFLNVLKAYVEPISTYTPDSSSWPEVEFRVGRNLDGTDFTGGNAVFFSDYLYSGTGRRVRLVYAIKFDTSTFTETTSLEADLGLADSMVDIPPLGAAWRLMISQEARRQDTRGLGQSRDATEVPATAALQTTQALKTMRDARIAEEQLSLVAKYGFNGGF